MSVASDTSTIILLSSCSFIGNIGAALTGFGQAILFLFVYQIVDLAGYDGDFKNAVFIQALSLFSMQPLLLYKANVIKYAHRRILLIFVPITLISTPLGQLVSAYVPTKVVQAVAGVLVTLVAMREIYMKRNWFKSFCIREKKNEEDEKEEEKGERVEESKENKPEEGGDDEEAAAAIEDVDDKFYENQVVDSSNTEEKKENSVTKAATSGEAQEEEEQVRIGCNKASIITLIAGGASGFLGGMVAIRGPPLIFYFLHPPHPVKFNKHSQRATGVVIMFFNVLMREIFYMVNTFTDDQNNTIGYQKDDWRLYLSVIICSIAGGVVGSKMFEYLKDSRDTIRGILSIFLFICGISLLFSAFIKR